jgi:hypothetical protein
VRARALSYTHEMRRGLILLLAVALAGAAASAQTQSSKKPAPKPSTAKPAPLPPRVVAPADAACPQVLGTGVGSKLKFCDVLVGRNPADGILINLPPHKGVLTLTFDLHNRHTYSEDLVKAGRGYASYTATIGVLAADGTLVTRGVVRSEFRRSKDLLDRVGGGAGPGGVKAIAPLGVERIVVDVPEEVTQLSLLGEKLTVTTPNGTETYGGMGRPIALVSNLNVDYQPPPPKPPAKIPAKKKAPAKK